MPSSFTRFRLTPANNSRIPFWGQLAIGGFWIAYALFSMMAGRGRGDNNAFHYIFLTFAVIYVLYVLIQNAPVFGTQSYLEITPDYIVYKGGLFKPKEPIQASDLKSIDLAPREMRLHLKDGGMYPVSLRQVTGQRRKRRLRAELQQFVERNNVPLRELMPTK
ncbi:hypothetical protein [Hymenobacter koreensis]|uniref:Uncharacterized protein n=1 Tax=Hymenobacter koreensis TaxID=1084523 RepID=A0ABP8IVH9_9BACT